MVFSPSGCRHQFTLGSLLGSGSFGLVYAAQDCLSGEVLAVKLERLDTKHPQLAYEAKVLGWLTGNIAVTGAGLASPTSSFSLAGTAGTASGGGGGQEGQPGLPGSGSCTGSSSSSGVASIDHPVALGAAQPLCFPLPHWVGPAGPHYLAMAQSQLGPSLEDLFTRCGRRFSLGTTLALGLQMIQRLQALHSKDFIHRDVKPDNFLMGLGSSSRQLFLIE